MLCVGRRGVGPSLRWCVGLVAAGLVLSGGRGGEALAQTAQANATTAPPTPAPKKAPTNKDFAIAKKPKLVYKTIRSATGIISLDFLELDPASDPLLVEHPDSPVPEAIEVALTFTYNKASRTYAIAKPIQVKGQQYTVGKDLLNPLLELLRKDINDALPANFAADTPLDFAEAVKIEITPDRIVVNNNMVTYDKGTPTTFTKTFKLTRVLGRADPAPDAAGAKGS